MITGVRDFKDNLNRYISLVRSGNVIMITEYGKPVAKLVAADWTSEYDTLVDDGIITPATQHKAELDSPNISPDGTASDLVSEQRR